MVFQGGNLSALLQDMLFVFLSLLAIQVTLT